MSVTSSKRAGRRFSGPRSRRLCGEPVGVCYFRLAIEDGGRPVSLDAPSGPRRAPARSWRSSRSVAPPCPAVLRPTPFLPSTVSSASGRSGAAACLGPFSSCSRPTCPTPSPRCTRRRLGRAFAVSHFAQSLDGRIATLAGDSKRIGSPSNLVHAHRMRALSDGVLIGSRTLRRDRPRLTVRHVAGAQPARIVLASSDEGIDALAGIEGGPVYVVGGNGEPVAARRDGHPAAPDERRRSRRRRSSASF